MPVITYGESNEAWDNYYDTLKSLIVSNSLTRICEVGGGANPALDIDFVRDHKLDYTILDSSAEELEKAPPGYKTVVSDICEIGASLSGKFDLVFSRMVAEHVVNGERFHQSVHRLLVQGGMAFHFFPTLYAPPFVLNRLVPEGLSSYLLALGAPKRDLVRHKKFPAYYKWCRGPTRRQFRRLESIPFKVLQYTGWFGHGYYYKKVPPVRVLHEWLTRMLLRYPFPSLTSYAFIVLRKEARAS